MKKMMAMLLASVMAAGIFTTTAFAYTGDPCTGGDTTPYNRYGLLGKP